MNGKYCGLILAASLVSAAQGYCAAPVLERTVGPKESKIFNMAAIGDSVGFSLGFPLHHKSAALVQDWVTSEAKLQSRLQIHAHSGALLFSEDAGPSTFPPSGEVPCSHPTVTEQADLLKDVRDLHLILVNGGINDFPGYAGTDPLVDPEWIKERTERIITKPMTNVLDSLTSAHPKALIVVTGYWMSVSEQSKIPLLKEFLEAPRNLQKLPAALAHILQKNLPPKVMEKIQQLPEDPHTRLVENSRAWKKASDEALRKAVDQANQKAVDQANQKGEFGGRTFGKVHFVPLEWGPEHSAGAPDSRLFSLGEKDQMFEERLGHCMGTEKPPFLQLFEVTDLTDVMPDFLETILETMVLLLLHGQENTSLTQTAASSTSSPFCIFSAAFHPNEKGNQAMADAVIDCLKLPCLHEWFKNSTQAQEKIPVP